MSWQMGWEIRFRSENPKAKKTKSYERYESYKHCRRVQDAVDAGASLRDLDFDHLRGYLVIGQNAFQNASLQHDAQSLKCSCMGKGGGVGRALNPTTRHHIAWFNCGSELVLIRKACRMWRMTWTATRQSLCQLPRTGGLGSFDFNWAHALPHPDEFRKKPLFLEAAFGCVCWLWTAGLNLTIKLLAAALGFGFVHVTDCANECCCFWAVRCC